LRHRDDIVRIALVVLDQDLDLAPVNSALLVDFLVPHPGGLQRVEAERAQLPGHRGEQADGDFAVGDARVGGLRSTDQARRRSGEQQMANARQAFHGSLPRGSCRLRIQTITSAPQRQAARSAPDPRFSPRAGCIRAAIARRKTLAHRQFGVQRGMIRIATPLRRCRA
jgi:hypothetical protein